MFNNTHHIDKLDQPRNSVQEYKKNSKLMTKSKRHKVFSKASKKRNKIRDVFSQHCRVRSVIQPKVQRREIRSNFSSSENDYKSKDSIRIPSMSWYIKNSILPKEGKEIQETIKKYLNDGGSLNSKSLPRKLISKRKSVQPSETTTFGMNAYNFQDYPPPVYRDYMKNVIKNLDEGIGPVKVVPSANPELKNLNLQAVEKIMLQKLLDQKKLRSTQNFMKHRKAKYKSRLNTAGAINGICVNENSRFGKPMSAQTSFRGFPVDIRVQNSKFEQSQSNYEQKQIIFMKKIKELEEEMKKLGQDSPSERENLIEQKEELKKIGLNKEQIKPKIEAARQAVKKPKKNQKPVIEKLKFQTTKLSSDNSTALNQFSAPSPKKMNNAATSTHQDYNAIPDMLSFQVVNNSPTFQKHQKDAHMNGSSPGSRSPIVLNKRRPAESPQNRFSGERSPQEGHKPSPLSNERFIGGGFMIPISIKPKVQNNDEDSSNNDYAQKRTSKYHRQSNEEKGSSIAETVLIMESRLPKSHDISKNEINYSDLEKNHHYISVDDPKQEIKGYVALEGKSFMAIDSFKSKNESPDRSRRVIKPVKNNGDKSSTP